MEAAQDNPIALELRKRWKRWLSGVCRQDRSGYINLVDGTWTRWVSLVMGEDYESIPYTATREEVKAHYQEAINRATQKQFRQLDSLYVSEKRKTH